MDRLTKTEFPSLKACDECVEFDECQQRQCVQVYDALLRLKSYEDLESQLQEVYGECDGLLEESIKYLVEHEGIDLDKPGKARLLTDGNVDIWEEYKSIGTVEECREAREKQEPKKYKKMHPCKSVNYYQCPCCNGLLHMNENFCGECGQAISWEDEE